MDHTGGGLMKDKEPINDFISNLGQQKIGEFNYNAQVNFENLHIF